MKVVFLSRKFDKNEISIEKVFNRLRLNFKSKNIEIKEIENPFSNGLINVFKAIYFFRNKISTNEIVHITGQIHYAAIALKTSKIIITVHDLGLYRDLSSLRIFMFKLFWIYLPFRKAAYIVTISQKTKNEIISIMPSVKNKILVIPNYVTIDIDETTLLNKIKYNNILIVGTRSNKNIERAIEALVDLDINLVIVGKLEDGTIEKIKKLKIRYQNYKNISENQLKTFYRESDILLFPSIYEGFGLPILEAQATNNIVITSDLSPMNEVGGTYTILVDPYSILSIRDGIIKALNLSFEERLKILKEGKNNLLKYQLEDIGSQYINLYKELNFKK